VNSPPEGPLRGERRLRHIDALRAIAALLVVWRHAADAFVVPGMRGHWLADIADGIDVGRIGVVVFFLVSGYVIPFSIHPERPTAIGSFLIKRFFRIFPAYWLSLPLGALTTWWIWGKSFGWRELLVNLTLLQDAFGVASAQGGLYWTLLVEWIFYLLCVVLLLGRSLANPRHLALVAAALAGAAALVFLALWLGRPLVGNWLAFGFLNLSLMVCGTLYRTCVVERAAADDAPLRNGVRVLFACHVLVFPFAALLAFGAQGRIALSYAIAVLLFAGGVSLFPLRTRITDWLGRISYSIYLFHPVVFMSLLWCLGRQAVDAWWRTQHRGWYIALNIVLTIALADLVYRRVEEPAMRYGRRLAARRAARRALRPA
jgi:peptidoglycan/LPS O-acetylase OafA/YrhL